MLFDSNLYDDLGMRNPYNNNQNKSDFIANSGDPDADGEMTIVVNGTEITIKQQVKDATDLSTTVDKAS